MANILIIPSGGNVYFNTGSAGSSEVANLSGSGVALNYDGAAGLNIVSYNTNDLERFTVDGSNGRLFNVSDEVTGDIFSVNDAAGLPIINVYSDTGVDVVTIGTYGIEPLTVSGSGISITGYMTLNNEPTQDKHAATKKYVDDHAAVSATTTTAGHVELATDAEAHAATDTTRAITPSNLLIKKDGTAIVAGALDGDSRGSGALDVQAGRNSSSQVASGASSSAVGYDNRAFGTSSSAFGYYNNASATRSSAFGYGNTASGNYSSAVGYNNTASGYRSYAFGYNNNVSANDGSAFGKSNTVSGNYGSSAFGYYNTSSGFNGMTVGSYNTASGFSRASAFGYRNTASGDLSSAFGYYNTASGNYSSAIGKNNTASGEKSSAIGYYNTASGTSSSAFGHYAKTTVNNTFEAGYWIYSNTRSGAIRMHPNGQVAMTVEDSSSAPTDGGATAGSEADGTLPRGMVAFRKNGADLYVDSNTSGTVSTLGLGILQSARVYSPRFLQGFATGSGAARLSGQASADTCYLQTGATTGSTAGATIGGNVALINGAALDGDNPNVINFSRKQSCLFKFATNASASCTGWIFWGGPFNSVWTGGPTGKSIGLKLDGNALKLVAHNGSSATTGSSILTMTANITYEILIVADGSGNLEAFRNGTSLGTITGAPTGSTAAPVYPSAQAVIENNATTTNANLQVLGIDIVAGELQ